MSRVLLISSNTMTEPYYTYPLGMAMVASGLSAGGHKVSQFDFLKEGKSHAKLQGAIEKYRPDYIGVSLRNIDDVDSFSAGQSWGLDSDRKLVGTIRAATRAPVVLGGPAFSIMPEDILEYVSADYGIVGDGTTRFCYLIEQLNQGRTVSAILRGREMAGIADMSVRPLWQKGLTKYYVKQGGSIGVTTKRGCPHDCAYCTYPMLEGNRYLWREPGLVVDDLEHLKKDHQVDTVFFTDSVFNDGAGLYLNIAEEILRRGMEVRWSAYFRPQGIGGEEMELLKRSGLYAVEAGTDAAHDATLEGLNKLFFFEDAIRFNEVCLNAKVPCAHHIMFGGPGETETTVREGLANLALLKGAIIFGYSGIRILPGTILHNRAVEEGVVGKGDSLLKSVFYFSPEIDSARMNNTISNAFKLDRNWLFPPSEAKDRRKVMEKFGFKGAQWYMMLSGKRRTR
jgi:lipid biosynthesis B12-binding/radical SAM protein